MQHTDNNLTEWQKDYIRWKQLDYWIDENTKGLTKGQVYELFNCIARYFTSLPLYSTENDKELVYNKFVQEAADKGIKLTMDIKFEDIASCYFTVPVSYSTVNKIESHGYVVYVCGEFNGVIPVARYKLLKSMGTSSQIMSMLLKYAMFPSASLSWQVPSDVYMRMIFYHSLTLEGCASPINSHILAYGGEYCSPFESDKVFGSVGNFFDIDLEGHVSIINPPFVEDFMLAAAKKVVSTLDNATKPTSIMFVAPAWLDAESHIMLSNSKHLKSRNMLLKNRHTYENAITGEKVVAKFGSTVFVLSNVNVDFSDAIDLF